MSQAAITIIASLGSLLAVGAVAVLFLYVRMKGKKH
jgi:hypothetical protein